MDIRRSIDCSFWTDEWVESIQTEQKLLFLYLLTNPLSNLLGIYKISLNRISFDTGIKAETVSKHLKAFESIKKVFYTLGHIIIVNHLRHQALNPNMRKNVMSDYNGLPNCLKDKLNLNASEGFESLSKSIQTLLTLEREMESESESESSGKKPFDFSFVSENFKESFELWVDYKKERKESYKGNKSLKELYDKLLKLSNNKPETALAIVKQSMANNYAGLFELKQKNTPQQETQCYR